MLVHNAPDYVETSIRTLRAHTDPDLFELVVLDNASGPETRALLRDLCGRGQIDILEFSDVNTLFARGNNRAAELASNNATHFLLLNSDIEVKDDRWLSRLLDEHEYGITSYGVAPDPVRVDGYCMLIDADLYRAHRLDTDYEWFWSVTKLQAELLREGLSVKGFARHEQFLHHFGGRSGSAFAGARGMDVTRDQVRGWFGGLEAKVLDRGRFGSIPGYRMASFRRALLAMQTAMGAARNRGGREIKVGRRPPRG